MRRGIILAVMLLGGCASAGDAVSFRSQVEGSGDVRLIGWASYHGEMTLYSSRQAMRTGSRYPDCISAVFPHQSLGQNEELRAIDGRQVILTGALYLYSTLPDEDRSLIPRKVLEGTVVPNWCFGDNVVLIDTIEEVRR